MSHGSLRIGDLRVLGKGFSSIVVAIVDAEDRILALKIRRLDSRRESLEHEALILVKASRHRLAPQVYWWDKDFILMEYVQGALIEAVPSLGLDPPETRLLLSRLLGKAYTMDALGIDHGELVRPYKHVIVAAGLDPVFLDFESASMSRRPHNLTTLGSALLLSRSRLARFFRSSLTCIEDEGVVEAMRLYKAHRARGYRLLLEVLGLLPRPAERSPAPQR